MQSLSPTPRPRREYPPFLRLLLVSALLCGARFSFAAPSPAAFYLSPTGSDSNPGTTPEQAFATLARARDAVRGLNAEMTQDILVEILPGDYAPTETVTFTEKDSGCNGHRVIYRSGGPDGSARFLGGVKVAGWTSSDAGVWQADIGKDLPFTTLYENGIRADMARWPKRTSPFATSRAGYMTYVRTPNGNEFDVVDTAVSPDGRPFSPEGKDFSQAWFYGFNGGDGHRWSSATTAATSVTALPDGSGFAIHVNNSGGLGFPPDSCLIENSPGLLSAPGEYFYDRKTGILSYSSRFGGAIDDQEIIAPRLVRLIDVSGASPDDAAHDIEFDGLAFEGTDRIAQSHADDWSDKDQPEWDAAVHIKNARGIVLHRCKVADAGVCGITLDAGATSCTVEDCLVEHTGYDGIDLKGSNDTLSDCLVRHAGELRGQGHGIAVLGDDNTLQHIEVYAAARAGVSFGGQKNLTQYVKVHDCVQDSGDQGAFYLVDPAKDNTFNQCVSFHNYGDLSNMDRPPTGIYNDRDATGTSWSNIDSHDNQMFDFRHDPQQKAGNPITFTNVSWSLDYQASKNQVANQPNPDFNKSQMEYDRIGVTADFPLPYDDRSSAPPVPLNLWIQSGNGEARLHWTEADRAAQYTVKRSAAPQGPFVPVGTSPVPAAGWDTGTTYADTGLTNGSSYYYTVTASNAAGESAAPPAIQAMPSAKGSLKLTGTLIGTVASPEKAIDGDLRTYTGSTGWVGLDLGSPKVITEIHYTPRSDNTDTTAWMYGGEFQGANLPDFSDATTLFEVRATKGGAGTPVSIPEGIFESKAFRYVRYFQPKNATIAEMEFYGHEP